MAKKTVHQGFLQFLKKIKALKGERKSVTSHVKSVRSCLKNKLNCSALPATGSFGNDTEIRHHSDSDFFAILPKEEALNKSSYVLTKVRKALKGTFTTTSAIRVDSPSVKVPFGKYASETMEITPCYKHERRAISKNKQAQIYGIPDSKGGWTLSSPQIHNRYVEKNNKRLHGHLKPFIKLVKAWKYYNKVPINSFYLELRCTKWMDQHKTIYNYDEFLLKFLKHLRSTKLASIHDPMKVSGRVKATKNIRKKITARSKLNTAVGRAQKAVKAKKNGDIDEAFQWWNKLFNGKFPNR